MNAGAEHVKAHELLAATSAAGTLIRWPIRPLRIRPLSVRKLVELASEFPNIPEVFSAHAFDSHEGFVNKFGRPMLVAVVSAGTGRSRWRCRRYINVLLVHAFVRILELTLGYRKSDDFFEKPTTKSSSAVASDNISLSFNPKPRGDAPKPTSDGMKALVSLVRLASEYQARTGVDALEWSPARVLFGHRALAEVDIKFRLDVARAAASIMSSEAAKTLTEV